MTIASDINKKTYIGNGVATLFAYPFQIFDVSDIKVYLTDPNTGNVTLLNTGYRVKQDTSEVEYPYPSGSSPLPDEWKITLMRVVPIVQETALPNQGPFFSETIEGMADKQIAISQQIQEQVSRSISHAVSVDDDVSANLPAPVPLHSFRWDSTGKKIETTLDPATVVEAAAVEKAGAQEAREGAEDALALTVTAKNAVFQARDEVNETIGAAIAEATVTAEEYRNQAGQHEINAGNFANQASGFADSAGSAADAAGQAAQAMADYYYATCALMRSDLVPADQKAALIYGDKYVAGSRLYTLTTNFVAGDTVSFMDVTFTCVVSGATGNQFNIGANTTVSAANLAAVINANATLNTQFTATSSSAVITITDIAVGGGNTPGNMTVTGTGAITNGTVIESTSNGIWIKQGASGSGSWQKSLFRSDAEAVKARGSEPNLNSRITKGENRQDYQFNQVISLSANLFNPSDVREGYMVYNSQMHDTPSVNAAFKCVILKAKPDTQYTATSTDHNVVFYDYNGVNIGYSASTGHPFTFTTPARTEYIAVSFLHGLYPPAKFMIVEGASLPSGYIAYKKTLQSDVDINDIIRQTIKQLEKLNIVSLPDHPEAPVLPFVLYRGIDGRIKADFDFDPLEVLSTTYYVHATNGLDTNNGLTTGTPLRTIKKALENAVAAATDVCIKIMTPVVGKLAIFELGGIPTATVTVNAKTIAIVPIEDDVRVLISNKYSVGTWTHTDNYYVATQTWMANVTGVSDNTYRDENGVLIPYVLKTSVADVNDTPGSWYVEGNNLYVHTHDSRSPDTDVYTLVTSNPLQFNVINGGMLYFKNIECCVKSKTNNGYGLPDGLYVYGDYDGKFIHKNCHFIGGHINGTKLGMGIHIVNMAAYGFDSVAAYNYDDGFDYMTPALSYSQAAQAVSFELYCKGYKNGDPALGVTNINASTAHVRTNIVRVGCDGYENSGPMFADVGGCRSVLIECSARDSTASTNNDGYQCGGDSSLGVEGYMWLNDCIAKGNLRYSLIVGGGSTGIAHGLINRFNTYIPTLVNPGGSDLKSTI